MAEAYQAHRQLLEQVKLAQALVAGTEDSRAGTTLMTLKVIDEWLGRVFNALEEGRPIVWNQFTTFSELLYAFDVQPLPPEIWTLTKLGLDMYACCESIDAAHEADLVPVLLLEFDKVHTGLDLKGLKAVDPLLYKVGEKVLDTAAAVEEHGHIMAVEVPAQLLEDGVQLLLEVAIDRSIGSMRLE